MKLSFAQAVILWASGFALVCTSPLIGLGGRFYAGDTVGLIGLLVLLVMTMVIAFGHALPALRKKTVGLVR